MGKPFQKKEIISHLSQWDIYELCFSRSQKCVESEKYLIFNSVFTAIELKQLLKTFAISTALVKLVPLEFLYFIFDGLFFTLYNYRPRFNIAIPSLVFLTFSQYINVTKKSFFCLETKVKVIFLGKK